MFPSEQKTEIPAIFHIAESSPEERALFVDQMLKLHKDFNEKIQKNPVEDPVFGIFPLKGRCLSKENEEPGDIFEEIECWDEGNQDPQRFLKAIEEYKMNSSDATKVFALYCNHNNLTAETVKKFIEAGADINANSSGYWTDQKDDNALSTAAEYRRIEDMKVLLECGAFVSSKEKILFSFIAGHSALYAQILSEKELKSILEGVQVLIDAGAKLSRDDLEFVDEEFFDNEFKQSFLEFLEETYYEQDPENYEPPRDKTETKWESDCLCLKELPETIKCTNHKK